MLSAVTTLVLLALGAGRLWAQQSPLQDWPPDDPTDGQYAPGQEPGYGQPPYSEPQYSPGQPNGYGQQQYPEQSANPQQNYSQQNQPYGQQGYGQAQPLSPAELEQLVAPIALYPDNLVAEMLAASTYPAQVAAANEWLQGLEAQGYASPEQVAAGANAQTSWDPSVKALTAFPQVLAMMDRNLQWTTNLGNAYYNQPQDVLQTIQVMRGRAEQAGNLESTPQAEVSNDQGYIDIAPANPQMVYVPTYSPWDVYGQPVSPYPGFSLVGALGQFLGSSPVQYGLGFAMQAFLNTPWGWLGWGLDWLGHAILFNHGDYWTHSTSVADWGFPRGGPRAYPGRLDMGRGRNDYGWSHGDGRGGANISRQGNGYGEGYSRGYRQTFAGTPDRYGDARTTEGFNHGYPSRASAYGRSTMPTQRTYSRLSEPPGRPGQYVGQSYGSGFGSGMYGRGPQDYRGRSGMSYAAPSRSYGSPQNSYQRGSFGGRSYGGYSVYSEKEQRSGGFHLFGGGRGSNEFKAPKSYSYGGSRSGWGGHGGSSRGWKAPKAGHFGGGHSGGHFGGHSSSRGGGHGGHRR